jgi:hypothetical protein
VKEVNNTRKTFTEGTEIKSINEELQQHLDVLPEQILCVVYCNLKFGRKEMALDSILGLCCELSLFAVCRNASL